MWQPPQFQTTVWCEYCRKKNHARDECWTKQVDERKARAAAKKQGDDPRKGKGKSDGKGKARAMEKAKAIERKVARGSPAKDNQAKQHRQLARFPCLSPLEENRDQAIQREGGSSNFKRTLPTWPNPVDLR